MQALEGRLSQMEEAFNTNTQAFSDGIQMMEAQQEVFRRVIQDIYNGDVRTLEHNGIPNGEHVRKRIDWNSYLKEYIEELVRAEANKEVTTPGSVLAAPDEDAPIIFGGDAT